MTNQTNYRPVVLEEEEEEEEDEAQVETVAVFEEPMPEPTQE